MRATPLDIFGVHITPISPSQIINIIEEAILSSDQSLVFYVNAHCLNLAYKYPKYRNILNKADVNYIDGYGVILAARILGHSISPNLRMTPPDWIDDLAAMCVLNQYSLYFLGARPGITEKAAGALEFHNPGLLIAGTNHGYFNKSPESPENQQVIDSINKQSPDILLVGFGMPLQESWIIENMHSLNVKVFLPVGALFDYLAGKVHRGPRILTNYGFEWLSRLLIEPRRLWRRYIIGNPLFLWRVFMQKLGYIRY